jgi:hypothetical protein
MSRLDPFVTAMVIIGGALETLLLAALDRAGIATSTQVSTTSSAKRFLLCNLSSELLISVSLVACGSKPTPWRVSRPLTR